MIGLSLALFSSVSMNERSQFRLSASTPSTWRAAQRVAVLQAMQRRGRRVDGQVLAQPRGDLHLPRVRLGGEQALVEVLRLPCSATTLSAVMRVASCSR
jgi:predicted trehalose synthase